MFWPTSKRPYIKDRLSGAGFLLVHGMISSRSIGYVSKASSCAVIFLVEDWPGKTPRIPSSRTVVQLSSNSYASCSERRLNGEMNAILVEYEHAIWKQEAKRLWLHFLFYYNLFASQIFNSSINIKNNNGRVNSFLHPTLCESEMVTTRLLLNFSLNRFIPNNFEI